VTDHVEMLRLLAVDALRVKDDMRAQVLFDAADYLAFLETSMMDEMDELISRIASMEEELGSLRC
jgi:hypothetical protein